MKSSTMIIIGIACVLIGLYPPVSLLCVASGGFCLYYGIKGQEAERLMTQEAEKDEEDE